MCGFSVDKSSLFYSCSWPAMCIHGDKHQSEREWVLGGKSFHTTNCAFIANFITLFNLYFVSTAQSFEVERVPF